MPSPAPSVPSNPDPAPQAAPTPPDAPAPTLGAAGLLAVLALVLPPLGSIALFWAMAQTDLGPWLQSHGWMGVLVYAGVFAALSGVALLPTYAQSALGGWAFGVPMGITGAAAGFAGGATIGFLIARRASGDRVEALVESKPKLRAVRRALLGPAGMRSNGEQRPRPGQWWKTMLMVALVRLPPNSPFALTNLVLASVKVPFVPFVLGTVLGMLPRTLLAVWIGALVAGQFSKDTLSGAAPKWMLPVAIGVSIAVIVLIGTLAQRAIDRLGAQEEGEARA